MLREHARFALGFSRRLSEGLLRCFKDRSEWLYQVHPRANHPLWIAGHLGLADNSIAARFRPGIARKPEGWDAMFWFGSQATGDSSAYPAEAEVFEYFRERRTALLAVLEELTDAELAAPAPPSGAPSPIAGAPSIGQLFIFAATHEGMHSGQLTVVHRALGHAPLFR